MLRSSSSEDEDDVAEEEISTPNVEERRQTPVVQSVQSAYQTSPISRGSPQYQRRDESRSDRRFSQQQYETGSPSPRHERRMTPDGRIYQQQPQQSIQYQRTASSSSTISTGGVIGRTSSPSPSLVSERDDISEENLRQREEDERKRRIQLYVFVLRCIAYPFNAKQPTDMARRQLKITRQQLQTIKDRFNSFLRGESSINTDEAFINAIKNYNEVFVKSERLLRMVDGGGCSSNDFREVFRQSIEKRVKNLPEMDGLSKDTVVSKWMNNFDAIYRNTEDETNRKNQRLSTTSELIMNKEQLYDMFQKILDVKKYEHQILHNEMQLDNGDEQASQVRRELDCRLHQAEQMRGGGIRKPKFVVKDMDSLYVEELKSSINLLMANLESLPVAKGGADSKYSLHKLKRHSRNSQAANSPLMAGVHHAAGAGATSLAGSGTHTDPNLDDVEPCLSKSALQLSYTIDVKVSEVTNAKDTFVKLPPNGLIYCTMDVEGSKTDKLQTNQTDVLHAKFDAVATFTVSQPLPLTKIKLYLENSKTLALTDELLSKLQFEPKLMDPKWSNIYQPHLFSTERVSKLIPEKKPPILKVGVKVAKPDSVKQCGYLYAIGKTSWKKWKKRYFVLLKMSNYIFALCSFRAKKSEPQETLPLDSFVVDYMDNPGEFQGGNCFFAIARGQYDNVTFAAEKEEERKSWVDAIYRATGQSSKPTMPKDSQPIPTVTSTSIKNQTSTDKAKKYGLDEYIQSKSCDFDHAELFQMFQSSTLENRLNDIYTSLGWFSPGQVFVLDEYCARYGVRGCWRHLCYLDDLLVKAENEIIIDPTLMHYSFAFCASHVHGNRPDGIGTITSLEYEKFHRIKDRLKRLLERQITNFRYCFPFGRPEGALKATLSLLERVLMKDIVTPVPPEEVRSTIKRCLEQAALINYTKISEFARMEELYQQQQLQQQQQLIMEEEQNPKKKLDDLIRLAEYCIEVLQQNEEYHAEAFAWFSDLLVEHAEKFWQLFSVDMNDVLERQLPDTWDSFPLFQLLNDYLRLDENLVHGRFHNHIRDVFAPQVVRYVDLMESSIAQSIHKGFEKESWKPQGNGCATSEDMLWKLDALQTFIRDLHWPEEVFAEHLDHRLKLMAADMIEAAASRTRNSFDAFMKRGSKGTDFIVPTEVCVMMNAITDFKNCALKLCALESGVDMRQYHTKSDEYLENVQSFMVSTVVDRLLSVASTTLQKLSRYDEGRLLSSFLSLTKPVDELGREYVNFMRSNVEQIRQKIVDELYILGIYEKWYAGQMKLMNDWLNERNNHNLHPYQLKCLENMNRKCYNEYELQGVLETVLKDKHYESICKRLQVELATHEMSMESSSSSTNLMSNPLSSTMNTTRKLLSMNGFARATGIGDSD